MPYRRLPTTDKARLRALEAVLNKIEEKADKKLAISEESIELLQLVKIKFSNTLTQYELDIKIQSERNRDYKTALDGARMYISHFIQVLFLSAERGEINGGLKFYGLQDFKGKVPAMNSEEKVFYWGKKIIEGEQKRIQNGGSAIYNPSIALVKIKVENFRDAAIFQKNLRKNTSRSFDKMRAVRKATNEFISELWNEIEGNIMVEDAKIKRQISEEYGIIYVFRRNEKKHLDPKTLQRDLLFEFN